MTQLPCFRTSLSLSEGEPGIKGNQSLKSVRKQRHMQARLLSIALLLTFFMFAFSDLHAQDFYDIDTVNTIEITFAENNWDQLLDDLYAAGNEDRLTGSALINGQQFTDIGVRYKGNSTYSANQVKNPLNIKLDYINEDQTIDGYGTLKLANVTKDPSFVRETLSYEIARKYMPASQANYINVYINGTHLGLYTNVQSVDKFFLGNHFNSNQNAFFKGELTQSGPPTADEIWAYYGTNSADYTKYFELKSDDGWDQLINMLDFLNNFPNNMETYLNVDRHLWMLAYDILLVNLDAPVNYGHNYYLYQDDANQFNPIIWDLNESFGGFSMLLSGPPLNVTSMQQLDPFLYESNADYPIISQVLSNPRYRKMYVAHMKTIMQENFSNDWYHSRALEIQNTIDSDVQNDSNKFYSYNNFLDNIDDSVGGGGGPGNQSVVGLTELMDARVSYINSQTEFQAVAPSIAGTAVVPVAPLAGSQISITAQVNSANFVQLKYRDSVSSGFIGVEMFDDGNHNDGAANDHIYGISLNVGSTDLQYYIYAENDDAAQFDPQRAAYEFYSVSIVGDLVINEFMASNDVTVADQDGEFDDWIELYNNTDSAIALNGYLLSDDGQELDQWAFPDVAIEPHSFLTVWLDNDEEQVGLHANFKLSASGETIYLSSPTLELIDEVTYGEQTTDITTGRYPNGTGDFRLMEPSFNASNLNYVDLIFGNGFEL